MDTTGVDYIYRKEWENMAVDTNLVPDAEFVELYKKNASVFFMHSEASRRTVIDLFLRDIVAKFPEFMIITEFTTSVENRDKRRRLNGQIDYSVCHRQNRDEPHLIVVEAKKDNISPTDQFFAECATVYYQRKLKHKPNLRAFGIHTTGSWWKFICIDQDGLVKESQDFRLNINTYVEKEVNDIYQHVHYVVQQSYQHSPRTSFSNPSTTDWLQS